jgi:tripartite-type tricarboxylate transporter receptor subunit TctC
METHGMGMIPRQALGLIALGVVLGSHLLLSPAWGADKYPSKTVSYMVYWPAGGRSDLCARLVAPYLEKYLGTHVVVVNEGGGSGVIGHKTTKEAEPDGYHVAQSGGTLTLQYTKPGISWQDYTWIGNIYSTPFVIGVPANSPYKSLKELVTFAKANPKKIKCGISGKGNNQHLASIAFATKAGIEFTYVPYQGSGPSVVALAARETDLVFDMMITFNQMIEAKKVKILAICSQEKRGGKYEGAPTIKDAIGIPFEWDVWETIFGPKGLKQNQAVYSALSEAVRKAVTDPELGQKLTSLGLDASYRGGDDLVKWMAEYDVQIKKIIYDLNMQHK